MHSGLSALQEALGKLALFAAIVLIGLYRTLLSPILHAHFGPACRFEPSCSEYARIALAEHGVIRGGYMTMHRLLRCRPMGGWGYDPVPSRISGARP